MISDPRIGKLNPISSSTGSHGCGRRRIKGRRDNWDGPTILFEFPIGIRKTLHTKDLTEDLKGKTRKHTKDKLPFPTDDAVKKSVYLALGKVTKKWKMTTRNWGTIPDQFSTLFEKRIRL